MSKIRCRLCGDVIESRSRHDLVSCRCGEVFVDGGPHYLRTGARTSLDNIEVLTKVPVNELVQPRHVDVVVGLANPDSTRGS